MALCLVVASCSSDGGDQDGAADGQSDVVVTFTVTVDEATATRAANEGWDDYSPTDPGMAWENAIDLSTLQVFVCDANGKPIDKVQGLIAHQFDATTYEVTGAWHDSADRVAQAKKVMVLANCSDVAKTISTAELGQLAFTRASAQYIPMWGVTTVGTLSVGRSNDLGTIDLLRSMARIKVSLRSDMTANGYTLTAAKLNRHNTQGYTLPTTFTTVANTQAVRFNGSLHIYESATTDALDMMNGTEATVYVPEYDNTSTAATPATISVALSYNGVALDTYTLQFVKYDADGAPTTEAYDLQRNHSYEFELYRSKETMKVSLDVRKWRTRTHSEVVM